MVYDITNSKSFENLGKWRDGFIENAGPDEPKTFPFVLLGNKVDREHERKVDTRLSKEWCAVQNDMLFYETSAKEGVSVEQAFQEIARKALKRIETNTIMMPESITGAAGGIKLSSNGNNPRGNTQTKYCC